MAVTSTFGPKQLEERGSLQRNQASKRRALHQKPRTFMGLTTIEQQHSSQARSAIQEALEHSKEIRLAVIGTGKRAKIAALQSMIAQAGHGGDLVQMDTLTSELQHPSAALVALQKAIDSQKHAISKNPEMKDETVAVAGDTTFFIRHPDRAWETVHKLERLGRPLTEEETEQTRGKVKKLLTQENVVMKWNIGAATANGKLATVEEHLLMEADPIPEELVEHYYRTAVESGLLYASNGLHIAMLELLQESGKVRRWGVEPGQTWRSWKPETSTEQSIPSERWMQEYKDWGEDFHQYAIRSVLSTTPHAILHL